MNRDQILTQLDKFDLQIDELIKARDAFSKEHQNKFTDEVRDTLLQKYTSATLQSAYGDGQEEEQIQAGGYQVGTDNMSDAELLELAGQVLETEGEDKELYLDALAQLDQED